MALAIASIITFGLLIAGPAALLYIDLKDGKALRDWRPKHGR
jgi:hypothetical protein